MGSIGTLAPHAASVARPSDADIELAPLTDTSGEVQILSAEYEQQAAADVDEPPHAMPWFVIPVLVLAVSLPRFIMLIFCNACCNCCQLSAQAVPCGPRCVPSAQLASRSQWSQTCRRCGWVPGGCSSPRHSAHPRAAGSFCGCLQASIICWCVDCCCSCKRAPFMDELSATCNGLFTTCRPEAEDAAELRQGWHFQASALQSTSAAGSGASR